MTYALFSSSEAARRAVQALRDLHVRDEAISVVDGTTVDTFHEGDGGRASPSIDPVHDGRGAAPSTDPLHAAPTSGQLEGGRAPDSEQRHEANKTQVAAAGLGVAALGSVFFLPGLGIVLGAGALAAALAGVVTKNSGAAESSRDLANYLRTQNLSDDSIDLIASQLDSGGSLLQIDTVTAELPETQILQVVSDHGGRIAWDLGSSLSHSPTANHP
jgi:hypothetical protein